MDPRSALTALGFSIAIHVSAGVAFYSPSSPRTGVPEDAIFLSSVTYKEPKKIFVPEHVVPLKLSPEPIVKKKALLPPQVALKKSYLQPPLPVQTPKVLPGIMRADELAASPEKGKVFAQYFSGLRQEINEAVTRRFAGEGEGKVTILFILSETGKLQSVTIVEGQTDADLAAKRLVLTGVREAAPFAAFPSELGIGRIAFTLMIVFEEN